MWDTPAGLHILMSKLDISDGFWRLIVRDADCFNFAYVLLQWEGKPCRMVVPSAVQMGWVESPSLFCAVTESARDLAQHFVDAAVPLPPHQVKLSMAIKDVPMRGRAKMPSKFLQVYVDDFCYAVTQSKDGAHIPIIRRRAIHGIMAVFPPPAVTKHQDCNEPILASKLLKGDGNFESKKDMIGFSFDGIIRKQCIYHQQRPQHTSGKPIASCAGNRSHSKSFKVWSGSSNTPPLSFPPHAVSSHQLIQQ
jgi:hypothetical protein